MFSTEETKTLMRMADVLYRVRFGSQGGLILCAKWDAKWQGYKPYLISWAQFEKDEEFLLVSQTYEPVTYQTDTEPEEDIVTGSIDPKSGRRRKVIDPYAEPVKAAPIEDQVDWKNVPAFKLPMLDMIHDWSKAKDQEVNSYLIKAKLMKPKNTSVAPTIDFDKIFFYPNKKMIPLKIIEELCKKLHVQYPETTFDKYFQRKIEFQDAFSELSPTPALHEAMRPPPDDLTISNLRTLVESGHLDLMAFKMRVTALLMARDFKSPQQASDLFLQQIVRLRGLEDCDFERFRWIYRPSDFSRFRSVIYNLLTNLNEGSDEDKRSGISFESLGGRILVKKIWTRFEATMATLTFRQKKAVDLLYMQDVRPTLEDTATKLNISVASLRDRVAGAAKKLRDAFPEFATFRPVRSRTSLKNRPLIYDGLFRRESSKIRRPVTKIKKVDHLELRELLPMSPEPVIVKREPDPIIKKWLNDYKLKAQFVAHLDEREPPLRRSQ